MTARPPASPTSFERPAMIPKIVSCIVAYRPDDGFVDRIRNVRTQVDELVVVDNSEDLSLALPADVGATIIRNANRGGIAGALNRALDHARAGGFSHLCFFDHDSLVPDGMVRHLAREVERVKGTLIGPIYVNSATGHPGRFVLDVDGHPKSRWLTGGHGVVPAFFLITSGTVVSLERLDPSIRYDESMLVDMVDVEFCLRVRQAGGKLFLDTESVMSHGIGNREEGASRFAPPNYSANRYRMIVGNRILIWRRWFRTNPRYVALDVLVTLADFARNTLLLEKRLPYLRAVRAGWRDGWSRPLA